MQRHPIVLILEEHALMRRGLRALLEPAGCVCLEAVDLSAGLEACRRQTPDVVIVGGLNGGLGAVIALEALHGFLPHTRLILCADGATRPIILAALRAGAQDVVARPIAPQRLLDAVCVGAKFPGLLGFPKLSAS